MTENTNPAESAEKPVPTPPEAPKDEPVSAKTAPAAEPPAPAMKEGFFAESNRIIRETVEHDVLNDHEMPFIRNFLVFVTMMLYYVELPVWTTLFILFLVGRGKLAAFARGLRGFFIGVFLYLNPFNWPCLAVGIVKSGAGKRYLKEQGLDSWDVFKNWANMQTGGGCLQVLFLLPLLLVALIATVLFNAFVKIPCVSRLVARAVAPLKRLVDRIPERRFRKKLAARIRESPSRNVGAMILFATLCLLAFICFLVVLCFLMLVLLGALNGFGDPSAEEWIAYLFPFVLGFVLSAFSIFHFVHYLRFRTFDWKDKIDVADAAGVFLSLLIMFVLCIACIVWPLIELHEPERSAEEKAVDRAFENMDRFGREMDAWGRRNLFDD